MSKKKGIARKPTEGLVLDSSIAIAWCLPNEQDAYSQTILDALSTGHADVPYLWHLEVTNTLLVAERRKRYTQTDTVKWMSFLAALPIIVDEETKAHAFGDIASLARSHQLSAYDAAYLELAMRRSLLLATLDDKLKTAAQAVGVTLFGRPVTETALTNLTRRNGTRALNRFRMLCPFLEQGVPLTTVAKENGASLHPDGKAGRTWQNPGEFPTSHAKVPKQALRRLDPAPGVSPRGRRPLANPPIRRTAGRPRHPMRYGTPTTRCSTSGSSAMMANQGSPGSLLFSTTIVERLLAISCRFQRPRRLRRLALRQAIWRKTARALARVRHSPGSLHRPRQRSRLAPHEQVAAET